MRRAAAAVAGIACAISLGARAEYLRAFSSMPPGEVSPPWRLQAIRGRPAASFRVVARDGGVVEAVASGSVASLIHAVDVDPGDAPVLGWRWRIADAVEGSDLRTKSGDDFPARVYVLFDYDLRLLSFADRWRLRLARLVYGKSVPAAALCYVHARDAEIGTIAPNPYSARVRTIVVDSGTVRTGAWVGFSRDVAADFEAAFAEPAPRIVGIAIAIDTDDTGETARAYFGDIVLGQNGPGTTPARPGAH